MFFHSLAFLLILSLAAIAPLKADSVFVDTTASGSEDGTSWINAYRFLADAVNTANSGDTICVAAGTYYPGEDLSGDSNDAGEEFKIPSGVSVLGGFPNGGGTRDFRANLTVLSGDLNQDDLNAIAQTPADIQGTNAYHVVSVLATGILIDGFTITAGNAIGSDIDTHGGGIYLSANGASIRDCTFVGNHCVGRGGAVHVISSNASLINCAFMGNTSDARGGALGTLDGSTPAIVNCAFWGNEAPRGGACNFNESSPTLTNCSISGNSGTINGGGFQATANSSVTVENTIIWNNHAAGSSTAAGASINLISGSSNTINFSIVENTIGNDPLFVDPPDPAVAPSPSGNLDLKSPVSPAFESGSNAANSELLDIAGRNRVAGGTIDLGAYEIGSLLYVDSTATGGSNNGTSWADAYLHLRNALSAANAGDVIVVAAGVYYPDEGVGAPDNRSSSFDVPTEVGIIGGFPAGGGPRNLTSNITILSGDIEQNDTNLDGNHITENVSQITGANSYSVVSAHTGGDQYVSGFTITGGSADSTTAVLFGENGGGVYSAAAKLTMEDCVVIGNYADKSGGGLFFNHSGGSLELLRCKFLNNVAGGTSVAPTGGGLFYQGNTVLISSCEFAANALSQVTPNAATMRGLALHLDGVGTESTAVVEKSTFTTHGEAVSNLQYLVSCWSMETSTFSHCQFSGNGHSGASTVRTLYLRSIVDSTVNDCLFSGNLDDMAVELSLFGGDEAHTHVFRNVTVAGGTGVSIDGLLPSGSTVGIINSVFDQAMGATLLSQPIAFIYSHSLVPGQSLLSNGNLPPSTVPQFVNPRPSSEAPTLAGNYQLLPASPLVDAGQNTTVVSTFDLLGNLRIFDGDDNGTATVDIGAFESDGTIPLPDVKITAIAYNEIDGQITLTVEAEFATTYAADYSATMASDTWSEAQSGSLSAGTNTVTIPGVNYFWPEDTMHFRLRFP